ncbi:MAG: hypothetical protein D3913_15810, partial [Candidatus Electrothrix sp. LOE1_4_5]|nr:hypothetical protein [Candidatus Electrothrix gigas]
APVEKYLNKGILPALGTDSLTSNPELSLWREMRLLAEDHPAVKPRDILRMATLGGAEALGLDRQLGSLEAGKAAALLAVDVTGLEGNISSVADVADVADIEEHLVHQQIKQRSVYSLA